MSFIQSIYSTIAICILLACGVGARPAGAQNEVKFWYGPVQQFGRLGQPQRWINVLGHIDRAASVREAYYMLNGGEKHALRLGSDLHRLAMTGDFNVEISWDSARVGENYLTVGAVFIDGSESTARATVIVEKGNRWPMPYEVDFSNVGNLQNVVQIVDGKWSLTSEGVRTDQPYYDRVLGLGDTTWVNYEANVELTLHDYTPHEPGPPTYDVTHFGVALRWRGHHADGRQPSRQWYPLGAQGELLIRNDIRQSQWRILFDGGVRGKPPVYGQRWKPLERNRRMRIRAEVRTMPDGQSRYRFKQWFLDEEEPIVWDVEGFEAGDYRSGALCLVPHNSDVTIHTVRVTPLESYINR